MRRCSCCVDTVACANDTPWRADAVSCGDVVPTRHDRRVDLVATRHDRRADGCYTAAIYTRPLRAVPHHLLSITTLQWLRGEVQGVAGSDGRLKMDADAAVQRAEV